jgi:hypothetical protein
MRTSLRRGALATDKGDDGKPWATVGRWAVRHEGLVLGTGDRAHGQ